MKVRPQDSYGHLDIDNMKAELESLRAAVQILMLRTSDKDSNPNELESVGIGSTGKLNFVRRPTGFDFTASQQEGAAYDMYVPHDAVTVNGKKVKCADGEDKEGNWFAINGMPVDIVVVEKEPYTNYADADKLEYHILVNGQTYEAQDGQHPIKVPIATAAGNSIRFENVGPITLTRTCPDCELVRPEEVGSEAAKDVSVDLGGAEGTLELSKFKDHETLHIDLADEDDEESEDTQRGDLEFVARNKKTKTVDYVDLKATALGSVAVDTDATQGMQCSVENGVDDDGNVFLQIYDFDDGVANDASISVRSPEEPSSSDEYLCRINGKIEYVRPYIDRLDLEQYEVRVDTDSTNGSQCSVEKKSDDEGKDFLQIYDFDDAQDNAFGLTGDYTLPEVGFIVRNDAKVEYKTLDFPTDGDGTLAHIAGAYVSGEYGERKLVLGTETVTVKHGLVQSKEAGSDIVLDIPDTMYDDTNIYNAINWFTEVIMYYADFHEETVTIDGVQKTILVKNENQE